MYEESDCVVGVLCDASLYTTKMLAEETRMKCRWRQNGGKGGVVREECLLFLGLPNLPHLVRTRSSVFKNFVPCRIYLVSVDFRFLRPVYSFYLSVYMTDLFDLSTTGPKNKISVCLSHIHQLVRHLCSSSVSACLFV